jgi:hypothetical protein
MLSRPGEAGPLHPDWTGRESMQTFRAPHAFAAPCRTEDRIATLGRESMAHMAPALCSFPAYFRRHTRQRQTQESVWATVRDHAPTRSLTFNARGSMRRRRS